MHRIEGIDADREHQQSVDAQRNTGAIRQSGLERREKTLVDVRRDPTPGRTIFEICLEARALLVRINELMKTVRQLNAVDHELESGRNATSRIIFTQARKG